MNMSEVMEWTALSGLIGMVLPIVIELFAKKVKGKKKIVIVLVSCIVTSIAQYGVQGGFKEVNLSMFFYTSAIICTMAINSWNQMWKKWFPTDPNPLKETEEWEKKQTAFTFYNKS